MSNAQEAVKTRHKETSLIFLVLALVVLFLWGSKLRHYQWSLPSIFLRLLVF